jgi:hypothetical protein
MANLDITQLDVTKTNAAIERLREVTENPRHRFLLQSYYRHGSRILASMPKCSYILTASNTGGKL